MSESQNIPEFLSGMPLWEILQHWNSRAQSQLQIISISRAFKLTAYGAACQKLAMRQAAVLARFDRKLAEAARSACVRMFGDGGVGILL